MEKKTDKGFISSRNRPVADQVFKRGRLLIMQDRLLSGFIKQRIRESRMRSHCYHAGSSFISPRTIPGL